MMSQPSGGLQAKVLKGSLLLSFFVLAPLIAYWPALSSPFHFDDRHVIVENPAIRSLSNIPRFFFDAGTYSVETHRRDYRPLLVTSYSINYALHGLQPSGFHIVNIFLHIMTGMLLLSFLRLLGYRMPLTLIAPTLFLLHPLNTEAVTYVSSRSSVMATVWYLLAMVCYIRAYTRGDACRRTWLFLSLFSAVLGLLTKSIAITLFVTLFLLDSLYLQERRRRGVFSRSLFRVLPYALLVPLYLGLRAIVVGNIFGSFHVRSPGQNLLSQSKAVLLYLRLFFFPVGLNVRHALEPVDTLLHWAPFLTLALLVLGVLLFARWPNQTRSPMLGSLWFLITLTPSSSLIPLRVIAVEHRVYLPLIGLCWATGWLIARWYHGGGRTKTLVPYLGGIVAIFLCILTFERNRVWQDELRLWQDAYRKAPQSLDVNHALGYYYFQRRLYDQALPFLRQGTELIDRNHPRPVDHRLPLMLGLSHRALGKYDSSNEAFGNALLLVPVEETATRASLHYLLAMNYRRLQEEDAAREHLNRAMDLQPEPTLQDLLEEMENEPSAASNPTGKPPR